MLEHLSMDLHLLSQLHFNKAQLSAVTMSLTKQAPGPSYGRRTLPQALDEHAKMHPERLYASIPKDRDLSGGFADISCREMASCVNFMAHFITDHLGVSTEFTTIAYIGIPDLRSVAVFLGAVKCGYKVSWPVR